MADRPLVPVPHEHTHAPRSILEQAGKLGPDVTERERERKFNLSIQPALAYEDVSMLESSAKLRMAAKQ